MALMNCPECNHEVSDQAESCPNCGYVLNKKRKNETSLDKYINYKMKGEFYASCLLIPTCLGLIIWLIIISVKDSSTYFIFPIIIIFILFIVSIICSFIYYKKLFKKK